MILVATGPGQSTLTPMLSARSSGRSASDHGPPRHISRVVVENGRPPARKPGPAPEAVLDDMAAIGVPNHFAAGRSECR